MRRHGPERGSSPPPCAKDMGHPPPNSSDIFLSRTVDSPQLVPFAASGQRLLIPYSYGSRACPLRNQRSYTQRSYTGYGQRSRRLCQCTKPAFPLSLDGLWHNCADFCCDSHGVPLACLSVSRRGLGGRSHLAGRLSVLFSGSGGFTSFPLWVCRTDACLGGSRVVRVSECVRSCAVDEPTGATARESFTGSFPQRAR